MRFADAFREGFTIINRNWQLVLIQVIALIINLMGFVVIVILPVVAAVFLMGIDLTALSTLDEIPSSFGEFVTKYFTLFLVALAFFLFYLLLVTTIALFLFGASSGVIAEGVKNPGEKFSLQRFFATGKRLFFPMVRYMTAAGLLLLLMVLVVALILIGLFALYEALKSVSMTVGLLVGVFLALSLIAVTLFLITASLAAFFYGAATLIFRGKTAFASLREAAVFLYENQRAYWLYCLLFGGSIILSLMLMLAGIPLSVIPLIGRLFSIPYQIFSLILQTYVGFFITAVLFVYYHHEAVAIGIRATPVTNTFSQESPRHGGPPQG